jgi:TonB family protein
MIKIRAIIILLFLGISLSAYSQDGKINVVVMPDNTKHTEQYFKYPGGKDGLLNDIAENFIVPKKAKKDKIKGKIILQITIDTLGIANGKIIESLREDIDNAALEMTKKLKHSEPAKMDDKKVEFTLRVPLKL